MIPTSRSLRCSLAAVAAVLGVVALSGCGSTRYVLVQQAPANAAAAPTTTAASGPTSADDEKGVKEAVAGALGLDDRGFAERTRFLSGADDLEPTYKAVMGLVADLDAEMRVDSVAVNGDEATATVTVLIGGEPYAKGVPVALVRDGDAWKVTRDGACAALAIGSPCPEK